MQPDLLGITTSTIMEGISQGEFVPYLQPQMDASIGSGVQKLLCAGLVRNMALLCRVTLFHSWKRRA